MAIFLFLTGFLYNTSPNRKKTHENIFLAMFAIEMHREKISFHWCCTPFGQLWTLRWSSFPLALRRDHVATFMVNAHIIVMLHWWGLSGDNAYVNLFLHEHRPEIVAIFKPLAWFDRESNPTSKLHWRVFNPLYHFAGQSKCLCDSKVRTTLLQYWLWEKTCRNEAN